MKSELQQALEFQFLIGRLKTFPDVDSWEVSDYGDRNFVIKDGGKCNCGKGFGKNGSCIHQVLVELKKWDLEDELGVE